MGDAKVKQPFFGTQAHHHHHHHHHHHNHHNHSAAPAESSLVTPTATHSNGVTMSTAVIDAKHATSTGLLTGGLNSQQTVGPGAGKDAAGTMANPSKSAGAAKYEQLKQRKQELQKRLNEKYSQLQQIKREEAQLIGMYPSDFSCGIGPSDGPAGTAAGGNGAMGNGTAPTLRRKIGTSFKLPENLLNNKEDDINKLLLEKQIQQQISEASLRMANDGGQPKSVRRTHKQNYEQAQQKLLAINQNLSALKKRQQQQQQQQQLQQQAAAEHKPSARDDIDLHKTAQVNRFRSNSNSSSMLMHLSERRNSVKSTGSSNASASIAAQHHQHIQHQQQQQQQMLQVQIPPGHYHHSPQLPHHPSMQQKQQISPYSIHSGIIPSGSQSMTSAASAAMISQLSMLRHRARTDSFSGIVSYDSISAGSAAELSVKMSPISANGSIASGGSIGQLQHHHHHQQQQQQQPQVTVGPGPSRMNRLIQQQIGVNYSPPPGVVVGGGNGTSSYVLSPTVAVGSPCGNGGQAFVYDTKVIARLQGSINSNMHHFPSHPQQHPLGSTVGIGPHGHGHHLLSDQNLCPNAMAAPTTSGGYDQGISDHHASGSVGTPAGLGGYWMTLESGEKVWCSVDSRQFSSLDRKQGAGAGGSMKLSRTSTKLTSKPTGQLQPAAKSSSLGNFQEYIGKSGSLTQDDDMITVQPDAISVTSGSSEHKKREKVWRETSLDSPLLKHKTLPPVPPGPPHAAGTLPVNGHLLQSPGAISPNSPSYHHHNVATNNPTIPLHINTNVSSYTPSSPLLLSPQQMRYYQQRQQQLLEQQRQRVKQQQQQQRLMIEEQQKQMQSASSRQEQQHPVQHPNHPTVGGSLQPPLPMSAMNATSTAALTTTTLEHYNALHYQQHKPQNPPPYHSRHQHPPPPPLPPPNQHHYHHSQQRLQHPPPPPPPPPLVHPQHLDLLPPSSYTQHDGVPSSTHLSSPASATPGSRVVSHHLDGGPGYGYHSGGTLSSRHPDLLISPTLSQASSHTLTSPTTIVQALPIGRAAGDETSNVSPTPSAIMPHQPGGPKSDIQMESPKNMTVVQQGKIMPYKEVTKPFEMSDFYKYSTKYRQKQQQQQHQQPVQARPDQYQPVEEQSAGQLQQEVDGDGGSGEGIHKGIYQPPNRSICQPINNYN